MKSTALALAGVLAFTMTACDTKYVPKTAEEQKFDSRIKDRIDSAQKMIDFRSATAVISEKIQKMDAEKAEFAKDPHWTHYEKDYNDMIQKLKGALEARK
jgi:RNase H-fold protein (predicted Holliday junction resolvase)